MTCITNKNSESGSWAQKKKKVQNTVLLENANEKDESEWRREVLHTCMNVYKRSFECP